MMTRQKPFINVLTITFSLLLLASTIYAQPVQQGGEISLRAIGVRPVEPAPVPEANPIQENQAAAIGVAPTPQPTPQPTPIQEVTPVPQGPVVTYPAIGVQPTPQEIPGQLPGFPPGVGYPVENYDPNPEPAVILPQPVPGHPAPVTQNPVPQPTRAVVTDLNKQRVIVGLQNLINQQAAFGQFPHNSQMLSEISALISKHSQPTSSKVKVVNSGPGTLRVTHPNGTTTDVPPNFNLEINVGSAQVNLSAQFQNVLISLEHVANGPARFWDQDDQTHATIAPGHHGPAHKIHHTLIPGVWGHHLSL